LKDGDRRQDKQILFAYSFPRANLNVQYLVEYGNNCHQMALKNMNGKTSILIMKSITTTKENAPEIN